MMIWAVQHGINFDLITFRSEIIDILVGLNYESGRIFRPIWQPDCKWSKSLLMISNNNNYLKERIFVKYCPDARCPKFGRILLKNTASFTIQSH